jgi:hypothetical protein
MSLVFEWHINEDEWHEAHEVSIHEPPGGDYDRANRAYYWLLMADVQVRHGNAILFPPERLHILLEKQLEGMDERKSEHAEVEHVDYTSGVNINIFDFARIIRRGINDFKLEQYKDRVYRSYEESDGSIRYNFDSLGEQVSLSTTLFPDVTLNTTWYSVIYAYDVFITTLRSSIEDRASGLLAWESLKFIHDNLELHDTDPLTP